MHVPCILECAAATDLSNDVTGRSRSRDLPGILKVIGAVAVQAGHALAGGPALYHVHLPRRRNPFVGMVLLDKVRQGWEVLSVLQIPQGGQAGRSSPCALDPEGQEAVAGGEILRQAALSCACTTAHSAPSVHLPHCNQSGPHNLPLRSTCCLLPISRGHAMEGHDLQ